MQEKLKAHDWNKIVSESEGRLLFLPDKFRKDAEEWMKVRAQYNEQVLIMAKKELTLNMLLNDLFFEIRKYLEGEGHPDVWLKDVGFESNALDEGKFIVTATSAPKSQIPLR